MFPHEAFATFLGAGASPLVNAATLNPDLEQARRQLRNKLGLDPAPFVGLGLHGDGAPRHKSKSIEALSWNFVALPKGGRFLRAIADKAFRANRTVEAMLDMVCWSFAACPWSSSQAADMMGRCGCPVIRGGPNYPGFLGPRLG